MRSATARSSPCHVASGKYRPTWPARKCKRSAWYKPASARSPAARATTASGNLATLLGRRE
eukprot:11174108-Lingulodinium_polyedra.AAC.1